MEEIDQIKNNNTPKSLGSSIKVPSVQEMVKKSIVKIPPQYVRADLHQLPIIVSAASEIMIPVIDMANLEISQLHSACKDWGFFQLVNHGVSGSLMEKMKFETRRLFDLPIEEKKKLWQKKDDVEGFGQAFVLSEEQKLDWGDTFFISTAPQRLTKPRLFQNLPLPLRVTLEEYSATIKDLAAAIFEHLEKALGIKDGEITEIFKDGVQVMRMNYYPPCPKPEKVIGVTPHSDAVGLTILLQINEVDGLKIKKDGKWVTVAPLPNAFIVNIGDVMEMITNGKYRSIEHCVTVNSESERLSIATFSSPSFEKEIRSVSSLVTPHSPPLFRTLIHEEYVKGIFTRKLDGKSYLDALRIDHSPT